MARKLSNKLLEMFVNHGEYANILKMVNKDKELSLEIRDRKAIVYYKKGKILTLFEKGIECLSKKYYEGKDVTFTEQGIKDDIQKYFKQAKQFVDEYRNKKEFTIQQFIMSENSSVDNDYLVIDMEYQYEQSNIPESERLPRARIDLVAIEKESKDIVLFELKQGINALNGNSGVDDHIKKMNILIEDEKFRKALVEDVETIIRQKVKLQILSEEAENWIDEIKKNVVIKPMFIYVYYDKEEKEGYDNILKGRIPTIYFDFRYILKKPE